jgi:hypothetical protein
LEGDVVVLLGRETMTIQIQGKMHMNWEKKKQNSKG